MRKVLAIVAFVIITALLVKAAYITRGYFAVGGEWVAWVMPLLIWAARKEGRKHEQDNRKESGGIRCHTGGFSGHY